jgi:hypothetical protein
MNIIDEFDINIIKELEKMEEWRIQLATEQNFEYHGASTHQQTY